MKWFLFSAVCLASSVTTVRGDAAGDLYKAGVDALGQEQYADAAKDFDQIITGYPTTPNIDDIRLRAGFAYMHLGDYANTVDRLSKETDPKASPAYRGTALYFTGLAQFSMAQKAADKAASDKATNQAIATLTTLIDYINKTPSPDTKDYLEDAIYYRALAEFKKEDYASAEKDIQMLLTQFSTSLKVPDYLLLLGTLYATETNLAVTGKKNPDEIQAIAQKAIDTFNKVSNDPNALVQANDANMSKAEILYLIAQPGSPDYLKALDAYRLVHRKDDMIQLQQDRLTQLKKLSADALANSSGGAFVANANSRLIDRENGRLNELKNGPDPIVQALIRIAECYVSLKQPDEARTVIHRLQSHANETLTPEQKQELDFQLLFSYALGGQSEKADQHLTEYLAAHKSDPQADSISYIIAQNMMKNKDYVGAQAQTERSLRDFPNGRYTDQVVALEAQALASQGKNDESKQVLSKYQESHKNSPAANQMLLTKAQNEMAQGDLTSALSDYKSVKENTSAAADVQAAGSAGYIQVLQSMQKFDDVITESKAFAAKYPDSKSLPSIMLISALAMAQKNDPGAVAALQDVAKKYPNEEAAPFALSFIVTIYQRAGNTAAMTQASNDLFKAYPTHYAELNQAADAVGTQLVKDKKFDDAVALYTQLISAPKTDVAASAYNKIGGVWLAAVKAMGGYQSMPLDTRKVAETRLNNAQDAYLTAITKFPTELTAVGDAFEGLVNVLKQRRSWGLLTDADMPAYLTKLEAGVTDHDLQTRFDLAKAGLVFIVKNGAAQYPAALDSFKQCINPNPNMCLTRQEANQYGELLLNAKEYPTALQVYNDLLSKAAANDTSAKADADYGLGSTYLAQGDLAQAKKYFTDMMALPQGAAWHPHITDAQFGLALANEQSTNPADLQAAKATFGSLMKSPQAGIVIQAKSMIEYGRMLEKEGKVVATGTPPGEAAVAYYQQVSTLFGPAVPLISAEGLYLAGQAYDKAGDKTNAQVMYKKLTDTYGKSAPDWAAKAQAAMTK